MPASTTCPICTSSNAQTTPTTSAAPGTSNAAYLNTTPGGRRIHAHTSPSAPPLRGGVPDDRRCVCARETGSRIGPPEASVSHGGAHRETSSIEPHGATEGSQHTEHHTGLINRSTHEIRTYRAQAAWTIVGTLSSIRTTTHVASPTADRPRSGDVYRPIVSRETLSALATRIPPHTHHAPLRRMKSGCRC